MSYNKPWLSVSEQIDKLQVQGLEVTDKPRAELTLRRIGYYRLSGYWYPFRERSGLACSVPEIAGKPSKKDKKVQTFPLDSFKSGLRFQDAVDLYVFDKKLRLLVLDALERIEVALRVDISHTLGEIDPFAYLRPELLSDNFTRKLNSRGGLSDYHAWLANHAKLLDRSKEEFIKHNKDKYGLPIAIWIACEVWDFGCMSRLFAGLKNEHQDMISNRYGIKNGGVFASWLRSLNYLRNVCAHHSRLWNRNIIDQPQKPAKTETLAFLHAWDDGRLVARPFLLFCIIHHLLQTINPTTSWWERLSNLLNEFPLNGDEPALSLDALGTITGWQDWGLND
ncbi:MAG: abortive phage resistance protein [Oceanospirillaceae bacterium]|uniref:Abi family protein n=1 Tax=unclassified Thalassolituus TaxID=2624967 RepID=UPI000C3B309A|nr:MULTISPECIES: Abi family protein [unclassified Thalassolituus]MAS24459.1 abortive phage resistance protein [Oceanospirillaceae bacterium]MAX99757.1 abortive phage resistance protein [Oceanospirillaceae bacterium]MBL36424.1 abortive phage resistance protein [Oceanospirillaceae bacterium]MBS51430.1 abortive phage resistance protein [Oceanospirillaceae bacterium]|tara:strand:- start:371 stop:1381 length:1011 start_codon:yes stop_codon:yes gene_type:complete